MDRCVDGGGVKQEKQEAVWLKQMEEQQVLERGGTKVPIVSVPP